MTTKELYSNAIALIKDGNIQLSLKVAEMLPFERFLDFVFYCRENRQKQFITSDFWTSLIETTHYSRFFSSTNSYLFLCSFFKTRSVTPADKVLLLFLADNQPDCLIKAIRVSKSFLYDEWYSLFEDTLANHPNKKLELHFQ